MTSTVRSTFLLAIVVVLGCAGLASGQDVPQPEPFTLWRFLGIPEGVRRVRGNLVNRRGNFPNLEKRPPMRALADPRNLDSANPAIKAAAEIKAAELLAPQKIKALKYLAKMGCGCYDKDGKITNALLAAMADDCTEKVRLEAVRAVSEAARCQVCDQCNMKCCCNEKIIQQLAAIAYERDDHGCWLEPSARVRQAAEQALRACCNGGPPELLPPPLEGIEGNEGSEGTQPLPPSSAYGEEYGPPPVVVPEEPNGVGLPLGQINSAPRAPSRFFTRMVSSGMNLAEGNRAQPTQGNVEGAIVKVDQWQARASVQFTTGAVVPVGTSLYVYRYGPEGVRPAGSLVVSASRTGEATVVARPGTVLSDMSRGDVVIAAPHAGVPR